MLSALKGMRVVGALLANPGLMLTIFLGGLALILLSTQTSNIVNFLGFESRSELRAQISQLSEQVETLNRDMNQQSRDMEAMAARHDRELEVLSRTTREIAQVNTTLERSRTQLQQQNRALARQVEDINEMVSNIEGIDTETYIILPRAQIDQMSMNNYSALLSLHSELFGDRSSGTVIDEKEISDSILDHTSALASVDLTDEEYTAMEVGNTTNIDLINQLFNKSEGVT